MNTKKILSSNIFLSVVFTAAVIAVYSLTFSTAFAQTATTTTTVATGAISGTSYNDLNSNKTKDSNESGIAGITIKISGGTFWWNRGGMKAISTTTTSANGTYSFSNLQDGIYRVDQKSSNVWKQTTSDYKWVLIINGKSLTGLDFANKMRVSSTTATTTPVRNDDRDDDRKERKEEKREEQRNKKINKMLEKIEKEESRGRGNSIDD